MDSKKIGAFIKALRKEKNLTQKELAEILQCTDKAVSRWETGRGIPEVSFLIPLSDTLGVSVNELLMGERFHEEEIKEKTEQLIVDTISYTDKKIGGLKKMLYALFCIIQFLLFYILPLTGGPTDTMGIVFLMYIGTMVNAFILGLTPIKLKPKLLFTVVVILLFMPSVFLPFFGGDTEVLLIYTPTLAGFSFAFVSVGTGVRKLVSVIRKSLDE